MLGGVTSSLHGQRNGRYMQAHNVMPCLNRRRLVYVNSSVRTSQPQVRLARWTRAAVRWMAEIRLVTARLVRWRSSPVVLHGHV